MKVEITPATFSRAQTVEAVKNCLKEWPLQDTNNVRAFECSIEFVEHFGGPVGTLSEFKEYDEFVIKLRDGVVYVKKVGQEFVVVPRYELKWYEETNDGYIWDNVVGNRVDVKDVHEAALKQLNS